MDPSDKNTEKYISDLKQSMRVYLERVSQQNFNQRYDEAISLLESFRGKMSKSDAIEALRALDRELEMNDWQEEVFLELSCRLEGFTSYSNVIDWY